MCPLFSSSTVFFRVEKRKRRRKRKRKRERGSGREREATHEKEEEKEKEKERKRKWEREGGYSRMTNSEVEVAVFPAESVPTRLRVCRPERR